MAPARAARCSSTTSRRPGRSLHAQRDTVQRHPHDAAGALRAVRQLQQPAHECLRRGDHDADRGIRAPRGRHPADHQPRARSQQEPEPVAGLVHHRAADRHRRGSGLSRSSRVSPSAAACSARWRRCTSAARSRKRASTTSSKKHDGSLPIVGVNTFLPEAGAVSRFATPSSSARRTTRRTSRSPPCVTGRRATRRAAPRRSRGCRKSHSGGNVFSEPHGSGQGRVTRPDLACAVPGRRPVPPQHVATRSLQACWLGGCGRQQVRLVESREDRVPRCIAQCLDGVARAVDAQRLEYLDADPAGAWDAGVVWRMHAARRG